MEQELFLKYSTTSDDLIRQFEKQIRQLEIEQSDKIAQVLKLKRFREGMEKLREQAKMKFVKEQEKLEQKELDEMAAIRFAREMDTPVQSATGGLDRIRQGKQTSAGQGRRHLEQADATLRSSASLRSTSLKSAGHLKQSGKVRARHPADIHYTNPVPPANTPFIRTCAALEDKDVYKYQTLMPSACRPRRLLQNAYARRQTPIWPPNAYPMKSRSDIDISDPATANDISYSISSRAMSMAI